jgi:hypothetical protein
MVDNCYLNLPEFQDGTGVWARFLWGHPEQCAFDQSRPVVFLYNPQTVDDPFYTNCLTQTTLTAVLGVQAYCATLQQTTHGVRDFDRLWYRIKRALDVGAMKRDLPGVYQITNLNGSITTYSNARFSDMGIQSVEMLGSNSLSINNGEIARYSQQVELTMNFAASENTVGQRNPSITTV